MLFNVIKGSWRSMATFYERGWHLCIGNGHGWAPVLWNKYNESPKMICKQHTTCSLIIHRFWTDICNPHFKTPAIACMWFKTTKHRCFVQSLEQLHSLFENLFLVFLLLCPLKVLTTPHCQVSHHCARSNCLSCSSPPSYILLWSNFSYLWFPSRSWVTFWIRFDMKTRGVACCFSPPEVSVNENGASSPCILSPTILFEAWRILSSHARGTHLLHLATCKK